MTLPDAGQSGKCGTCGEEIKSDPLTGTTCACACRGEDVESSLLDRLISLQVGGCTCCTKTPNVEYHELDCQYRVASEAYDEIVRLQQLEARLTDAANRSRLLTRGLLFYAKGNHLVGLEDWDAPDDPNWLCPPPEPPDVNTWEQMMLEDGGLAATILRRAYGRRLSRYQTHNSLGMKAHQVCADHQLPQPCPRCAARVNP